MAALAITHITKVSANINGHKEELSMFMAKLGYYPIVLGLPWMRGYDISISFSKNTLTFDSDFCLTHCGPSLVARPPVTILLLSQERCYYSGNRNPPARENIH